jgi:hypothetical protein
MIVILVGYFSFSFTINYFDIPMNFFNINVQEDMEIHLIPNEFPCFIPPSGMAYEDKNGVHNLSAALDFATQYYGILAEGTPFYITGVGCLFPEGQSIISSISIGYQGASWYDKSTWYVGMPPLYTIPLTNSTKSLFPKIVPPINLSNPNRYTTMYWAAQGDYYPYLRIEYMNGSVENMLLSIGKVHVVGHEVLDQRIAAHEQSQIDARNTRIFVNLALIPLFSALGTFVLKTNFISKVKVTKNNNANNDNSNRKKGNRKNKVRGKKSSAKPNSKKN